VFAGGGGGLRAGEVEPRRAWRGQCQQPRQDALGPAPTGWRGSELARTGPDMPGARRPSLVLVLVLVLVLERSRWQTALVVPSERPP